MWVGLYFDFLPYFYHSIFYYYHLIPIFWPGNYLIHPYKLSPIFIIKSLYKKKKEEEKNNFLIKSHPQTKSGTPILHFTFFKKKIYN